MKKLAAALLAAALLVLPAQAVSGAPTVDAAAAVLMEKETGAILYEQNAHDKLEPASVTKVMTLLLVLEAIDDGRLALDDMVTVSAHAASMGGSQVYLKEGEQMSVDDMLKAVAVVSGNDAAVALAEHLAGSEEGFVEQMNQRAAELGMADTCFVNCTGLPAAGHLTSAHDIAVMSRVDDNYIMVFITNIQIHLFRFRFHFYLITKYCRYMIFRFYFVICLTSITIHTDNALLQQLLNTTT